MTIMIPRTTRATRMAKEALPIIQQPVVTILSFPRTLLANPMPGEFASPAIGLQNRIQRTSILTVVRFQRCTDEIRDVRKTNFPIKEMVYRDLIRRVQDRGGGSTRSNRII